MKPPFPPRYPATGTDTTPILRQHTAQNNTDHCSTDGPNFSYYAHIYAGDSAGSRTNTTCGDGLVVREECRRGLRFLTKRLTKSVRRRSDLSSVEVCREVALSASHGIVIRPRDGCSVRQAFFASVCNVGDDLLAFRPASWRWTLINVLRIREKKCDKKRRCTFAEIVRLSR